MVSVYSTVLNNALNHSPFFTYNTIVHPRAILSKLLLYYGIFLALQFALISYNEDIVTALTKMVSGIFYVGLVMLVILSRLSRFKLIQNRWKKITVELPFSLRPSGGFAFSIKGDGLAEADVGILFGKQLLLCPLSQTNSTIEAEIPILMTEKLFLDGEEVYYRILLEQHSAALPQYIFLKAKIAESTKALEQYPIVAVLYPKEQDSSINTYSFKDFHFVEWAYLKESTANPDPE
jgi:hypothetical protein